MAAALDADVVHDDRDVGASIGPWMMSMVVEHSPAWFAPAGLASFLSAVPVWIKEKLLLKRLLLQELSRLAGHPVHEAKLLFPEHHLSHAASAFYPSPYESAAVLCLDGVEISTTGGHYLALGMTAAPYPLAGEPERIRAPGRRAATSARIASASSEARDWRSTSSPRAMRPSPLSQAETVTSDTPFRSTP